MSLRIMRLRPILHLRTLVCNVRKYFDTFLNVIYLRKLHRILCKDFLKHLLSVKKLSPLLNANKFLCD